MVSSNSTYAVLLTLVFISVSQAQISFRLPSPTEQHSVTIRLTPTDTSYTLSHRLIIEGSEEVFLDSLKRLTSPREYSIDRQHGIISLNPSILQQIFADSSSHTLLVRYRPLPLSFRERYALREMVVSRDSSDRAGGAVSQSAAVPFRVDDLFGPGLQKSGSIVRGFTVGSNRDLTLNSGFRMQLSGSLSSDVDIAAVLTDENSPIQPEGTTQTLQEVDQVFVELTSSQYAATLGDFQLQIGPSEGGEFGRLFRKLQGARGVARFQGLGSFEANGSVTLTGATARGKFTTNQFQGVEGNQGPYRLTSREGDRRIIVLAGTERIYFNGERIERGEIQDYTIDYASGEVTFTPRRLITSASRIVVDFEYSDRQFSRNLVGASVESKAFGDRLRFNLNLVQEADDPDASIDVSLDDAAKERLRNSGADRFAASISGVRLVERDSLTQAPQGQYILRDTTILNKRYTILIYAPGDPQALYAASFANVDLVPLDSAGYSRVGVGHFEFAGIGKGNYLPIQFLPMPQLHRVITSNLQASLSSDLTAEGELAMSNLDRNRFSSIDDRDNQGTAYNFALRYAPKNLTVGGTDIGDVNLALSERYISQQFSSMDRFNEIEFNRKWDIPALLPGSEKTREASIRYLPVPQIALGGGYGSLERSDHFRSERLSAELSYRDSALPALQYTLERISSTNLQQDEQSKWLRQRGTAEYGWRNLIPSFRFESEERRQSNSQGDSPAGASFRFTELAPRLSVADLGPMQASAEFQIRTEDSVLTGTLRRASRSFTQSYSWRLQEWRALSSSLSLNIRNTEFTEAFKDRGNTDSEVILMRSQVRYSPLQRSIDADFLYELANQRSSQLERVFVRVPKGTGNYLYEGDKNGNGIADEDEFELTRFDGDYIVLFVPGDRLVPVIDLKTGLRVRLQPSRVFSRADTPWEAIVRSLSSETTIRIEERSTETDTRQIYLLNLERFQNDRTTIAGSSLWMQDLHVFENDPALSFRLRVRERRGLLKLGGGNERSLQRERSVRVRSQLLKEIGNQTEVSSNVDRVLASVVSTRERDIASSVLNTEFSYRPEPRWEVAFGLGVSRAVDRYGGGNTTADINEQLLRVTYALLGSGQLRGELEREEVLVSDLSLNDSRPLAYELTNGREVGKTFLWNLAFDYRINQHVQVTVNYQGRTEGGSAPVHTARAEARAFF